ncbi:MAG: cation diffusion facilitator family transporter [Defluviitaleaceae bacterium]|nr:cation diffusion facilitator family transporter [Defluviitaleaceae bacterium]
MKNNNERIAMKVARNSIIVNVGLAGFKLLAGIVGQSAAMVSDAVHSITDLVSTVIVIIGIKLANRKEDKEHQYGHERFESVATLVLAGLILSVGLGIGWAGVQAILSGNYELSEPGVIALIAAVFGVLVKEGVYWYLRAAAKKTDSSALMADAWHSRADGLSSIGSFVGILGARMGFPIMDSIAAIVICLFIIKTAAKIAIDSLGKMTDRACDEETASAMQETILAQESVESIDLFRTRIFGNRIYVDVEIGVNESVTFKEAHEASHRVHDAIEKEFPKVKHCKVHANPIGEG